MRNEYRVMFGLIRSAVCGVDPDEETVKSADRETLETIYDTAAAHGVAQIIGDQISRRYIRRLCSITGTIRL